jgi:hypothetical protein
MQSVEMRAISLPELPPKLSKDVAAKLFPGFERTEVRTTGATIPVVHKGEGPRCSPSASRSTYPICEDTVIRAARPTEIATSTTRSAQ